MNEDSKRSPQGCRNSFEKSESNCQRNESNKTIYNNLNEERVKTTKKRSHFNEFFVPYASKPKASILTESFYSQDNPLISLTHNIIQSYKKNNPNFNYRLNFNPKRALTKPSIPTYNNGYDNENHDLIIHVNSILGTDDGQRYVVVDILGQGTFGQVVRCQNLKTKEYVAIKIIKGKQAYFNQSMMEITILELLNQHYDPNNNNHLIRLFDTFSYRNHLCLVFELLSVSLYDLIKQNKFRGLSPNLIRVFAKQILEGLVLLSEAHIIHADLKPENILLKNLDSPELKIIDFGSACHEHKTIYTYIQSRFYRSPEVILGLPYSASIDMWSVGCILVELFLGLPLFPGTSEYNQLSRIVELLGNPPQYMLEFGKNSEEFFNKTNNGHGNKSYQLKSIHQYSNEKGVEEAPSKRYFPLIPIPELIRTYPILKKNSTPLELQKENEERLKFTDFVLGFLTLNPIERWSPQQALLHPFVTGEPYRGHFKP
ncbi:kinase-like protein, partial [Neoconidiobolus thromboides FSU 785]